MRAVWLENGVFETKDDAPKPEVDKNEALVKVLRTGICNTDLEVVLCTLHAN